MVLDERSRHDLYLRLEQTLGAEAAATLMEHLPPVGWADVATKRDLDALEERLVLRFERRFGAIDSGFSAIGSRLEVLEHKLTAAFRGERQTALTAQSRQRSITLAGTMGAVSTLAFAAARLT